MARGVFAFSKDGRHRLAGVLRALLIAQLVVSLFLLIFCYNASHKVMMLLTDIHKVTVILLHGLVILQVYAMKLHYTSGLRLVTWFLKCPHWARAAWICRVWMISGSLIALNGMVVYSACNGTLKALNKELSSSLRVGISQYLTEPTWKRLLDTMQVDLGCCGAEAPTDWHQIPWINMDFLNENSTLVMTLAGSDGKVLPPVCPYSCCTPRVLAACYHDPLQQSEWREVWSEGSPLLSASLHTAGCVEAVRAPLTRALLALQLLNGLILLFQILIVVLTKLLQSSAQDAVLNGDYEGIGQGYIFRKGPPLLVPRRRRHLN
ncbi:RDS/peripherin-like protein xRDS35 isoform X2 [Choristoneura fumiferana]|uniref:RDS/peripherin-like protein xRDS35 isoform X2 n=1 Tax=Choristoneura fumiferana TaxID=7141 RepID=UPI003D156EE8